MCSFIYCRAPEEASVYHSLTALFTSISRVLSLYVISVVSFVHLLAVYLPVRQI
jgi:hypothetical protein